MDVPYSASIELAVRMAEHGAFEEERRAVAALLVRGHWLRQHYARSTQGFHVAPQLLALS